MGQGVVESLGRLDVHSELRGRVCYDQCVSDKVSVVGIAASFPYVYKTVCHGRVCWAQWVCSVVSDVVSVLSLIHI